MRDGTALLARVFKLTEGIQKFHYSGDGGVEDAATAEVVGDFDESLMCEAAQSTSCGTPLTPILSLKGRRGLYCPLFWTSPQPRATSHFMLVHHPPKLANKS